MIKTIAICILMSMCLVGCGRNKQCYIDCVESWDGSYDRNPDWCRSYCSYYGD